MSAIKQTFSWWAFTLRNPNPLPLLAAAKKIGYEGVELIPEKFWPEAREQGLEITAANLHNINPGLNRVANWPEIERQATENFAKAQQWGIKHLICFSGNRNGLDDMHGTEACIANLRKLAPMAESAGVTLVMELLNSRVDHPDYQADSTPFAVNICEQVNSPAVKILYDIYHMQIMEGDVIATIGKQHKHIGHYHTAGVPGRKDPDETQELNYPAIYRAIQASGFSGYIGHEFIPKADPLAALERAWNDCEAALKSEAGSGAL